MSQSLLAFLLATSLSFLHAQECETALEDALESFDLRRYTVTIATLTECAPERFLANAQKISGYELLAMAHVAVEEPNPAYAAIDKLLDLQPEYSPQAPRYTTAFKDLVEKVKKDRRQREAGRVKSLLRNKWVWVGGIAASSVAAYFIFKKDEPVLLPEAPDPPNFP